MNHSELGEITFHGWEEDDDPANKMVRKTWEENPENILSWKPKEGGIFK